MEEYRACVIGSDGHVIIRVDIRCSDQMEARRLAKSPLMATPVELWQTNRFIERFEPEGPPYLRVPFVSNVCSPLET
jgi:hypothetical protein